jgi:hypothetical protein
MSRMSKESTRRYRARLRGEDVPYMPRGVAKGYKQSPDHVAKRSRSGDKHHRWLGDAVSEKAGRTRAHRLYKTIGPCWSCGSEKSERHHIDGNTANNRVDNIAVVCRRCHMAADGRLDEFRELAKRNQTAAHAMRWAGRTDTAWRSGHKCPKCGRRLSQVSTRKRFVYIGCRKARGGCGFNAGSYRRDGGASS